MLAKLYFLKKSDKKLCQLYPKYVGEPQLLSQHNIQCSGSPFLQRYLWFRVVHYTDKKENQIFLRYKEIQSGAVAK